MDPNEKTPVESGGKQGTAERTNIGLKLMNKLTITFLVASTALVMSLASSCKPARQDSKESEMSAHLILNGVDELTWKDVSDILEPLTEAGYTSIRINGFYWTQYEGCRFCRSNEGGDPPPLILTRTEASDYDYQQLDDWCSANTNILAMVSFGDQVGFHALERTTQIMHKYKMTFDIKKAGGNPSTLIRIEKEKGDAPVQRIDPTSTNVHSSGL